MGLNLASSWLKLPQFGLKLGADDDDDDDDDDGDDDGDDGR